MKPEQSEGGGRRTWGYRGPDQAGPCRRSQGTALNEKGALAALGKRRLHRLISDFKGSRRLPTEKSRRAGPKWEGGPGSGAGSQVI